MNSINVFQSGKRCFDQLPKLTVELYLTGDFPHTMNGKNNIDEIACDAIRLICMPDYDYISEITESLQANNDYSHMTTIRFVFPHLQMTLTQVIRRKLGAYSLIAQI